MEKTGSAPFLEQVFIFSAIMLVSDCITTFMPIPIPASVIGMVILFALLCFKVVKLDQVESLGDQLLDKISFLFVPSGISVFNYLDIMKTSGLQITIIIAVSTIVLLAGTGWFAQIILGKKNINDF